MFKSIRSQLAVNFAGIALVTAGALGVVLLAILQNYYRNLELDYLRGNAEAISTFVAEMTSADVPHDDVQALIENLAFLSQVRIQVYDPDEQMLYDSGPPQDVELKLGTKHVVTQTGPVGPAGVAGAIVISVGFGNNPERLISDAAIPTSTPPKTKLLIRRSVRTGGPPFGIGLNTEAPSGDERSHLTVTEPIVSVQNATKLGAVVLSEGPAYGSTILKSVAWGWTVAGLLAVLLAAGVGWYMSRRISAPVLALTDVTARMAQGELSSRASVTSRYEIGQLARSFNEMAAQVETTITTLHRFVSDAAHELHTPLTALRADLDLAAQEIDAAVQRTFVERARTTVLRLETLTNNLLDLSRLEAQPDAEPAAALDLAGLVWQSAELYASQAEQAGLSLTVQAPQEPVWIRAEAKQVQRALNNLVDNACKFTPSGGSASIRLAAEKGIVRLCVDDTGIGIPADELPHLFSRFRRSRNAASYPGSGLGLAIVKAIMEQQGGHVIGENRSTGARFTLQWDAISASSFRRTLPDLI